MAKPLSDKQQRFVTEYLVDHNATKAAMRAGYSEKTAQQQGSRLLCNVVVKEAIAEGQQQLVERIEYDAQCLLEDMIDVLVVAKRRAMDEGDAQQITAFRGLADSVGKHVDVQAFRERLDVNVKTDHAEILEAAVQRAAIASQTRKTLTLENES